MIDKTFKTKYHFPNGADHPKDFELLPRSKKTPIPNFCKGHVHQNILSQHKSKPHWLLSFLCGPWQDIALFESGKICSLSLIVSSKTEGVALFTCKWVGQSESALIFTHASRCWVNILLKVFQ